MKDISLVIAALQHVQLKAILAVGKAVAKFGHNVVSNNLDRVLSEALAGAELFGVTTEEFVRAYYRADELRRQHAEEEKINPAFVPLNFVGRPQTDDHALNVVYQMVSGRIREEAIEEGFRIAAEGYAALSAMLLIEEPKQEELECV